MVRLYWKNLSMVRLPPLTFQKIPLAPFTRILLSAAEIFLQTQIRLHLLPLPESCSLTPRMMRPSIFRMLRLLLLQDSMRSVSMHLPNRRVYLRWINKQSPLSVPKQQPPIPLKHPLIHSKKWQPEFFLFPLRQSCVFPPFLFFSFLSSTLPTWEDNSPARKMIFLSLNHAAALFLFRPLFFLFLEHNLTSCPHTCCTLFPFTCQNLAFLIFFP